MPRIKDINFALERKIDLSQFFRKINEDGTIETEEAFVTIKRMGKYNFSFLLNKNRLGYTARLYSIIDEWRKSNPEEKTVPAATYEAMKNSISAEESEERLKVETEVDRSYYEFSIKKDAHNFIDEQGNLIDIEGGWFYDNFASLTDENGATLNDTMINEIVKFNHKGIVLGESNASR